jgi:hypothetical protein
MPPRRQELAPAPAMRVGRFRLGDSGQGRLCPSYQRARCARGKGEGTIPASLGMEGRPVLRRAEAPGACHLSAAARQARRRRGML